MELQRIQPPIRVRGRILTLRRPERLLERVEVLVLNPQGHGRSTAADHAIKSRIEQWEGQTAIQVVAAASPDDAGTAPRAAETQPPPPLPRDQRAWRSTLTTWAL